jgi:hypothetical protein
MSSPLGPNETSKILPDTNTQDNRLVFRLKENPKLVIGAVATVLVMIIGIAAIIAIGTPLGERIGGGLFGLLALFGFLVGWLWFKADSMQFSVSILSSLALALGTGIVIWTVAPSHDVNTIRYVTRQVPAKIIKPATITIDQPTPDALVGGQPTISGSVANLTATQYVWTFSQPFNTSPPYGPRDEIYPYKQCTVSSDRTSFVCPGFNGSPDDYCRMALLWVSVIDSKQADSIRGDYLNGIGIPETWPQPPFSGETSDYVLVQHTPALGQTCPGANGQ